MGRVIRRVPLDFEWPLKKVWDGFRNPYYKKCSENAKGLCYGGLSLAGQWLSDLVGLIMLAGEDAKHIMEPKGSRAYPHVYFREMQRNGLLPTQGVPPEFLQLTEGLAGRPIGFFGHDGCDRYSARKLIREAAGLPEGWDYCKVCNGNGYDPTLAEARETWEKTPPPEGTGWQVWEDVSEGSPVTPVFPTEKALIDYLVDVKGYTWEGAANFTKSGWAVSMLIDENGPRRDIETCSQLGLVDRPTALEHLLNDEDLV